MNNADVEGVLQAIDAGLDVDTRYEIAKGVHLITPQRGSKAPRGRLPRDELHRAARSQKSVLLNGTEVPDAFERLCQPILRDRGILACPRSLDDNKGNDENDDPTGDGG